MNFNKQKLRKFKVGHEKGANLKKEQQNKLCRII